MTKTIISIKDVAYALDIDVKSVDRYRKRSKNPLPIHTKGAGRTPAGYDLRAVVEWFVNEQIDKRVITVDGEDIDYQHERARLTRAQAEACEIKNEQSLSRLVSVELLSWTLAKTCSQIVSILEAIPLKVKRRLPKLSSSDVEVIKREVVKALNVASKSKLDIDGYSAEQTD